MADLQKEAERGLRELRKGNVDVFPQQLYLQCGLIEIRSDGKSQHTAILIDGKPAKGIYSLKININTQRATKIELGVFLDEFEFNMRPRKEN